MTSKKSLVPIWEKRTLTVTEAVQYFGIGRDKLRRMATDNPNAKWVLMDGSRIRIKRELFEKLIDEASSI